MERRHLAWLVLIVAGAVVLFGVQFLGSPETESPALPTESLTDPEREWCEANPGRVAGVAHWEYQDQGAPALFESERTSGSLGSHTEAFLMWKDDHPELFGQACQTAFGTWAGNS